MCVSTIVVDMNDAAAAVYSNYSQCSINGMRGQAPILGAWHSEQLKGHE